jgi:serine/threonine protein phosphatase PrpC
MSLYYSTILTPKVGYNQLSIAYPFSYLIVGDNMETNKYSTISLETTFPQYYNQYILKENYLGLKTIPNTPSRRNTFNSNINFITSEKRNYPYNRVISPNNYIQRKNNIKNLKNYGFNDRNPRYSVRTMNPMFSALSPYSPKNIQQINSANSKKLISPRIPIKGINLYSSFINANNNENNNVTSKNYNLEILDNNKTLNNTQMKNNIQNNETILKNNATNFSGETQEINKIFQTNIVRPRNNEHLKQSIQPIAYTNNLNMIPKINNKENIIKEKEIIFDSKDKQFFRNCNSGLIKSYAYYEDHGERDYMEDQGKSIENLNGDPNQILFCLFDGHGGGEVSEFLKNNFSEYMKKTLPFKNYPSDFAKLFKLLDKKVESLNAPEAGSTAGIAYIEKINGKRFLYCANVGDTRSILIKKNNRILRLSYDDRVSDRKEKERIIKQGGIIFNGRIYGQLMLSRCFGDWSIKEYGVIVLPHVARIELTSDDLYLILATDGVWDVLSDDDIVKLTQINSNSLGICKNIVIESLNRESEDNISCFVISL